MNSPLRHRVTSLSGSHCLGLHYIDWSAGDEHPKTLGVSDLLHLRSSHALFARKFDMGVDADVLDALDEHALAWRSS
jgi:hypothetical protein